MLCVTMLFTIAGRFGPRARSSTRGLLVLGGRLCPAVVAGEKGRHALNWGDCGDQLEPPGQPEEEATERLPPSVEGPR
jgi:hypothetical protein